MQEFDETTITEAVLARVRGAPDVRVRQVGEALVRHLHAFIREVEPTEAEWEWGIRFLTEIGQRCSATRQEFILWSDTLGVSMLVDAINHRLPQGATETTIFGPFYVTPPRFPAGANIKGRLGGSPLYLSGSVSNANGESLTGATVDVWHSDSEGFYDLQKLDEHPGYAGRGRFQTDDHGRFHLWTIRPTAYPIPHETPSLFVSALTSPLKSPLLRSTTWSHPLPSAVAIFSLLPTAPITSAPRCLAHWHRMVPTPPAAA